MWTKLAGRDRVLLIVLLALGLGFCLFRFVLVPQVRAYAAARDELADASRELARYQALAASLKEESQRLEKLRDKVTAAGANFSLEMRNGADIILLGLAAAARNVKVTAVEPGVVKENKYTLELPLGITAEGNYASMLEFCKNLESAALRNLAEIRSVKIEGINNLGSVRATLGLVVYSDRSPQGKLVLETLGEWLAGRANVFQPAGAVAAGPGGVSGTVDGATPVTTFTSPRGAGALSGAEAGGNDVVFK